MALVVGFHWEQSVRLETSDGTIMITVVPGRLNNDVALRIDAPRAVNITRMNAKVKEAKERPTNEPA